MTLNEYSITAHGYFLRDARSQQPLRRIWHILYNANSTKSNMIRSYHQLAEYWPLITDDIKPLSSEDQKAIWERAKEAHKRIKEKENAGRY